MSSHLGRAIRILEDALRLPPDLSSVSVETLYGRLFWAVVGARSQLYSVDASDAGEYRLVDVCQARAGTFRCRAPAVVLDDAGVAWCAAHAPLCGQMRRRYREYWITYNPKPVSARWLDWDWAHVDYDGAPDSRDIRCGSESSEAACMLAIDDLEADMEDNR